MVRDYDAQVLEAMAMTLASNKMMTGSVYIIAPS